MLIFRILLSIAGGLAVAIVVSYGLEGTTYEMDPNINPDSFYVFYGVWLVSVLITIGDSFRNTLRNVLILIGIACLVPMALSLLMGGHTISFASGLVFAIASIIPFTLAYIVREKKYKLVKG